MNLNQHGQEVYETPVCFPHDLDEKEAKELLLTLITHLGLEVWATNGTKSGFKEIQLRKVES